jgi:protein TonB
VLVLRPGSARLLPSRVYLDFDLRFDFRFTDPRAVASVSIRSWEDVPRPRVYRIVLPHDGPINPAKLLIGRGAPVRLVEAGQPAAGIAGQWQRLRVLGEGALVTIELDGVVVGLYEIEDFGGAVSVTCAKGSVELRNVTLADRDTAALPPAVFPGATGQARTGVKPPAIEREVRPEYTLETRRRGVQGIVEVEAIVLPNGTVGLVRVIRPLDPDLDRSAIAAVKRWRFKPGTYDGMPVPMLVNIELTFKLSR